MDLEEANIKLRDLERGLLFIPPASPRRQQILDEIEKIKDQKCSSKPPRVLSVRNKNKGGRRYRIHGESPAFPDDVEAAVVGVYRAALKDRSSTVQAYLQAVHKLRSLYPEGCREWAGKCAVEIVLKHTVNLQDIAKMRNI